MGPLTYHKEEKEKKKSKEKNKAQNKFALYFKVTPYSFSN